MAACVYKLLFLPQPPQLKISIRGSSKAAPSSTKPPHLHRPFFCSRCHYLSTEQRQQAYLSPLCLLTIFLMTSCYIPFLDSSHPQSSGHLSAFSVHPENLTHTPMISLITLFGYCLFTCLFLQWPMRP